MGIVWHSDRDFFGIGHIELQCEMIPGQLVITEPKEYTTPEFSAANDTACPFLPTHIPRVSPTKAVVDIDSRLPSLYHWKSIRIPLGLSFDHDQDSGKQPCKLLLSSMSSPSVTDISHSTIQAALNREPKPSPPAAELLRKARLQLGICNTAGKNLSTSLSEPSISLVCQHI
ncbi:hypothetical protein COCSADRAFT_26195 [Bipolaris sorokiniana ND90Pr]|uniref:Uncharacterized protein n=1 Tax=Cochliobolus sativus (strain ND90Pr / ATCC 201652) TaxID=665912 RepID=M2T402_COCSN|nr:uncharacterized protein COCSADRAFT_26195 [Bipolaris sorokiniana ND90Pr]EMD63981.1 hypothetical protein COCSADRAFT_26195 [Bipolaris sorokiniana ND90Pr]